MTADAPWMRDLARLDGAELAFDREFVSARQVGYRASVVVRPRDGAQMGEVLRILGRASQPFVLLAGNTGLVGANVPEADEVVVDLSRLDRILALELSDGRRLELSDTRGLGREERLRRWDADLAGFLAEDGIRGALEGAIVRCEAAVAVDDLNAWLLPAGLHYPMDMGSNSAATLGGCTANASAGARALRFGTGAEMALMARGWWANGEVAESVNPAGGRNSGPQDLRIDSSRFIHGDSLIGSQGTLGVVCEVAVRLARVPTGTEVVLIGVGDLEAGARLVAAADRAFAGPGRCLELAELIGRSCVDLVARKEGLRLPFEREVSEKQPWFIMLQARAETAAAAEALQEVLLGFVEEQGAAAEHLVYDPTPGEANAVRRLRHSITHASDARLGELRAASAGIHRLGFDVAVPPARCAPFLAAWQRELAAHWEDLEFHAFGHLGVGGFHLHHLGALAGERGLGLMDRMAEVVGGFGGTFSAEHGVGTLWAPMLLRHRGEEELRALASLFRRRDPAGLLAPRSHGKRVLLERYRD